MVDEILREISWNDIGVMGGLVALAYILKPVFLKWLDNAREGIKAQREFNASLVTLTNKIDADAANTQNLTTAVRTLNDYMSTTEERMKEVTDARVQWQNLITDHVKSVPAETIRLLNQNEPHQEMIREALSTAINPMLKQIEEKLDQMPGADASRQMIREEVKTMVEQVATQITPLFEKLEEIAATLDTLKPTLSQEPGETKLPDQVDIEKNAEPVEKPDHP